MGNYECIKHHFAQYLHVHISGTGGICSHVNYKHKLPWSALTNASRCLNFKALPQSHMHEVDVLGCALRLNIVPRCPPPHIHLAKLHA